MDRPGIAHAISERLDGSTAHGWFLRTPQGFAPLVVHESSGIYNDGRPSEVVLIARHASASEGVHLTRPALVQLRAIIDGVLGEGVDAERRRQDALPDFDDEMP